MRPALHLPSICRVRYAHSPLYDATSAIQVEHVCLEAEEFVIDRHFRGAPVGPSLSIASEFRGRGTELAVLDGHRLAVRTQRRRRTERQYVVDLRYIDQKPVIRLRIAWYCWSASVTLAALAAASNGFVGVPDSLPWLRAGLPVSIGLLVAAIGVGWLALYRTHERIQLQSVHGRAALVDIKGNPGCSRAAAIFLAELERHIAEARARAALSKQQFLCDELHEHRRLLEEGVLTPAVYESSKRRILHAHG